MRDFIFLNGEFTRLFEEFELLAALAYLTLSNSLEDLQNTLSKTGGRDFAWSPIGRAGWDGQTRRQILKGWNTPEANAAILKAGFANKSAEYYKLAIDSLSRLAEHVGWRWPGNRGFAIGRPQSDLSGSPLVFFRAK
ncbi:hypothetical protein [Bradyrhizobium sp. 2S1]|uniref:hypothetical protein n=1 Tax=Bradyrhizobium sp. 2S1 TaxID=1404429 RepID=UPI0014072E01|nr:hypothetical protein [Bradyrhizobium sp. 2S1]MCK7667183.1 hypothetical protein [Bradyrhizobium sp. 2S1]